MHVAFFVPHLVDGIKSTIFALLSDWNLSEFQKVSFGHHIGIEGACVQGHVHHTCLHRIAHLKGGDGFGAADEIDLQDAFAFSIDLANPGQHVLNIDAVFSKRADQTKRDLLRQYSCTARGRKGQYQC